MSFQEGVVVDYLGDNKFVIKLKEDKEWDGNPSEERIQVAHDYVRFYGNCSFEMQAKDGKFPYVPKSGAANWVNSRGSITIAIRDMIEIVLPYLNGHKYLQKEHIKDRIYDNDDPITYKKLGLDKPVYKKGDTYPAYAYSGCIIRYYDEETKSHMVAFRRVGSAAIERVSSELFNTIKDSLKLSYSKWEIQIQSQSVK